MIIREATSSDIALITPLFDKYRQFYKCESNIEHASKYLEARVAKNESIILICFSGEITVGFTQLYPTFCSVELSRIFVLYDLYVIANHRNLGVGTSLLNAAKSYAMDQGASRLDLETEINNRVAQNLYEKLGYEKDTTFYKYSLQLE
jgi:ribosomal protein S18 acetylase RimI-like enzyme